MFQTNEMGTSFIATPLKTNLVTDVVTSWWERFQFYVYLSLSILAGIILLCCISCICSCGNCCIGKFFCNTCIAIRKKQKQLIKSKKLRNELGKISSYQMSPLSKTIVMNAVETEPSQPNKKISKMSEARYSVDTESITFLPDTTRSRTRSISSEQSKRRRSKHRDDVFRRGE